MNKKAAPAVRTHKRRYSMIRTSVDDSIARKNRRPIKIKSQTANEKIKY